MAEIIDMNRDPNGRRPSRKEEKTAQRRDVTRSRNSNNYNRRPTGNSSRRKKRQAARVGVVSGMIMLLLCLLVGVTYLVKKVIPTGEVMELSEFYSMSDENQTYVIINGKREDDSTIKGEQNYAFGINDGQMVYLELKFVKDYIDEGYVYDSNEGVLKYATDSQVYTATIGSSDYMIDKTATPIGHDIIRASEDKFYIAVDYLQLLSDFKYSIYQDPSRIVIETAGWEKQVSSLKKKVALRRFGGNKSKILEAGTKGEGVIIMEDYGKWKLVLSDMGVLGCVQGKYLTTATTETVEKMHPERVYNHIKLPEKVAIGWYQSNEDISAVLDKSPGINVICPTWYHFSDNYGGVASSASSSFVTRCHEKGVQVWGLVSNLEQPEVDTTAVLNSASAREKLVNNLLAEAITTGIDGINVDIESLSASAADGYMEFIKELSIKCEKNDLVLSVDNYVPSDFTKCYNWDMEGQYCDYICVMAYDEHIRSSEESGSVASIGYVKKAVSDLLQEVPAEQIVLGIPLYCRVWKETASGEIVDSDTYGVKNVLNYISDNGAAYAWDEETGQNYCEFKKGDYTYKIWIEDATSIDRKLAVMKENSLGGCAFWKLGFENEEVWTVLAKYL